MGTQDMLSSQDGQNEAETTELSDAAVAARKARMERLAFLIASLPVLDSRSVEDIVDDLNAL
jgi:hypothetical protein